MSSTPSRAGALKVGLIPVLPECGLRASPVSWLGGFTSASFPRRRLANVSLQCPALCCFRLTVARRRRLALRPLAISAAHRLPVHEACSYCRGRFRPLWIIRDRIQPSRLANHACAKFARSFITSLLRLFTAFQDVHSRPPIYSLLDRELRLENLFEQIALIHARWRAYPQTFAFLHQYNLIGVLAGQI